MCHFIWAADGMKTHAVASHIEVGRVWIHWSLSEHLARRRSDIRTEMYCQDHTYLCDPHLKGAAMWLPALTKLSIFVLSGVALSCLHPVYAIMFVTWSLTVPVSHSRLCWHNVRPKVGCFIKARWQNSTTSLTYCQIEEKKTLLCVTNYKSVELLFSILRVWILHFDMNIQCGLNIVMSDLISQVAVWIKIQNSVRNNWLKARCRI